MEVFDPNAHQRLADMEKKIALLADRVNSVLEMVVDNDKKHEAGHKRLRESIRDLAGEAEKINDYFTKELSAIQNRLASILAKLDAPIDITRLVTTPKVVMSAIAVAASVLGGAYWASASARSDIRDIITTLNERREADRARDALHDSQMKTMKDAIDAVRQETRLKQYDYQSLEKAILSLKGRKP